MLCTESVFDSYNCAAESCGGCLAFCKCISNCETCVSTRCYCGQRYFLSLAILFTFMMLISCICFVCKKYTNSCTISTLIVLLNLAIASGLCMFLEPWDIKYEVIWGTTFLTLACTFGVCISYFCYPNFAAVEDDFDFQQKQPKAIDTPPKKKKSRHSVFIKIIPRIPKLSVQRTPEVKKPVSPESGSQGISHSDSEETTSFSDHDVYSDGLPDEHPAFYSHESLDMMLLASDSTRKSMNYTMSWDNYPDDSGNSRKICPTKSVFVLSNGSNCEIVPL